MKTVRIGYQSYLLRLWRERPDQDWRVTLQDVMTGECHNFSNLGLMCDFIHTDQDNVPYIVSSLEEVVLEEQGIYE